MLLLLDSVSTVSNGEDSLTRLVQEYDAWKARYSLQKEANLIKQKNM